MVMAGGLGWGRGRVAIILLHISTLNKPGLQKSPNGHFNKCNI